MKGGQNFWTHEKKGGLSSLRPRFWVFSGASLSSLTGERIFYCMRWTTRGHGVYELQLGSRKKKNILSHLWACGESRLFISWSCPGRVNAPLHRRHLQLRGKNKWPQRLTGQVEGSLRWIFLRTPERSRVPMSPGAVTWHYHDLMICGVVQLLSAFKTNLRKVWLLYCDLTNDAWSYSLYGHCLKQQ